MKATPERLTFLRSGAAQQVFVDPADERVVYKIPAVYPELLPHLERAESFRPTRRWKSVAWSLGLGVAGRAAVHVRPLLSWHLRRMRARRFRTMLLLLDDLQACGSGGAVLPHRVIERADIRLTTPAGERRYRGPVVVQSRADVFVERELPPGFDSAAVVRIQHRLWSLGFGLDDADTVLGPHNWAVLDGAVYLGDTGSLTRRRARVSAMLEPALLDGVAAKLARHASTDSARAATSAHIALVREHLRLPVLAELWPARTAAAAPASPVRGT